MAGATVSGLFGRMLGAMRNRHEFGAAEHPLLVPRASQKPPMLPVPAAGGKRSGDHFTSGLFQIVWEDFRGRGAWCESRGEGPFPACSYSGPVESRARKLGKRSARRCPFHIAQTAAFLCAAFGAICMLLPTVPPALMLLPLGSLSNLMKSSTAVCPASSWPPPPSPVIFGEKN